MRAILTIDLREDLAVTIALARGCQGVVCPLPGDADELTTCAAGRCVDPACSELTPENCPPGECSTDGECTPPSACAVGLCVESGCFFAANDSACLPGQTCAPTMGGVDVGGPMDAGMDAGDSSVPPADGGRDAGVDAGTDAGTDAGPACASEVLLASTSPRRHNGRFSGVYTMLVIVLVSDFFGELIGDEDLLADGYSGVTDFRNTDDPDSAVALVCLISSSN